MTDNILNLDELNELKQAYQLIDEKLDGKEIVTPEQIRTATMNNIGFLERTFKRDLSWSYLAFIPVLAIWFAIEGALNATGWWILGIYSVVEVALRFMLIRMINRADHSTLDLKTLLRRENTYMKADIAIACLGLVFWGAFNFMFLNTATAIIFVAIVSLSLIIKIKAVLKKDGGLRNWRRTEVSEPGIVRKIFIWFFGVILAILVVILTIGTVYNSITVKFDPIDLCSKISFLLSCILIVLMPVSLKKIRNGGYDRLYKVIMVLGIVTIVLGSIPVAMLLIAKSTVEFTPMFPIVMALLVLYSVYNVKNR